MIPDRLRFLRFEMCWKRDLHSELSTHAVAQ